MTAWALRASILIVLQAHKGQWCTLAFLAGRVVAPMHKVEAECEALRESGDIQVSFVSGTSTPLLYGFEIAGDQATIIDVAAAA